jgi:dihydrofolate reductase
MAEACRDPVDGSDVPDARRTTLARKEQQCRNCACLDEAFASQGDVGIGATIMGRNMFGPVRGPWGSEDWTGWWGEDPPYHHPVFVLTRHPRASIGMQGGTTFHFVTDGINAALEQALGAADGNDVRLGGGAACIQEYLRAGLVDEMHLALQADR